MAIEDGAAEVDIVINRTLALQGKWTGKKNELRSLSSKENGLVRILLITNRTGPVQITDVVKLLFYKPT